MNKYDVNDKVHIRADIPDKYDKFIKDLADTTKTVSKVVKADNGGYMYLMKEDGGHKYWPEELIDGFSDLEDFELHVTSQGKTVTASLSKNGRMVAQSHARCHPEDSPNFEYGAQLAIARLFDKNKLYMRHNNGRCEEIGQVCDLYTTEKEMELCTGDFIIATYSHLNRFGTYTNIISGYLTKESLPEFRCLAEKGYKIEMDRPFTNLVLGDITERFTVVNIDNK